MGHHNYHYEMKMIKEDGSIELYDKNDTINMIGISIEIGSSSKGKTRASKALRILKREKRNKALKNMSLIGNRISYITTILQNQKQTMPHITHLHIDMTCNQEITYILELFPNVERLSLVGEGKNTYLSVLPSLKEIEICIRNITKETMKLISTIPTEQKMDEMIIVITGPCKLQNQKIKQLFQIISDSRSLKRLKMITRVECENIETIANNKMILEKCCEMVQEQM